MEHPNPKTPPSRSDSPFVPSPRSPPCSGVMDLRSVTPLIPSIPPGGSPPGGSPTRRGQCSPKRRLTSVLPKKLLLESRDKEALMEEIMELKRVLFEQSRHIKFQKVHTSSLEIENRKLEKDIEDLERVGVVQGPRTGGPSRLRAKLQGLKMRMNELQSMCDAQGEELCHLKKDVRVTHTKEVEIERDVFAGEVENLQRVVKRLSATHNRISCQNKELLRLKEKAAILEATHHRLETSMRAIQDTLEKANGELKHYQNKARESLAEVKRSMRKCKELQRHIASLEAQLQQEKVEKERLERKAASLEEEVKKLSKELEDTGFKRLYAFKLNPDGTPAQQTLFPAAGFEATQSQAPTGAPVPPLPALPAPEPPPRALPAPPPPSPTPPAPSPTPPTPQPLVNTTG